MANIEKFARFIAVYIYSVVLKNEGLFTNKQLWEMIKPNNLRFDPETMRKECFELPKTKTSKSTKPPNSFVSMFRRASAGSSNEQPETAGHPAKLAIVAAAK